MSITVNLADHVELLLAQVCEGKIGWREFVRFRRAAVRNDRTQRFDEVHTQPFDRRASMNVFAVTDVQLQLAT